MIIDTRRPAFTPNKQYIPYSVTRGSGGLIISCAALSCRKYCRACIFKNCCQLHTGIKDRDIEALRALWKLFKKMQELMERRKLCIKK
ncbi:MAG: hypothetical protein HZB36_01040 [Candidatus Omnitrophica bacterium]|nr:hypothetical protein [Candidatus Omnitrophota bacterium]